MGTKDGNGYGTGTSWMTDQTQYGGGAEHRTGKPDDTVLLGCGPGERDGNGGSPRYQLGSGLVDHR